MTTLLALTVSAALAATPVARPAAIPTTTLLAQATAHANLTTAGPKAGAIAGLKRDSLANGATIGAIAGAIGMGGFVGFLCIALDETEGHGDCVDEIAIWSAIGAAGGAALGVGIDALFDRPSFNVRVRF